MAGGSGEDRRARVRHTWPVGAWGDPYAGGGQPQKYIVTYAMSANRQRPFAGFLRHGLWNTWRRFNSQVWYWAPPLLFAYWAMSWAEKKNAYINSKAGRKEYGGSEE